MNQTFFIRNIRPLVSAENFFQQPVRAGDIQAWQALPSQGTTLIPQRFLGHAASAMPLAPGNAPHMRTFVATVQHLFSSTGEIRATLPNVSHDTELKITLDDDNQFVASTDQYYHHHRFASLATSAQPGKVVILSQRHVTSSQAADFFRLLVTEHRPGMSLTYSANITLHQATGISEQAYRFTFSYMGLQAFQMQLLRVNPLARVNFDTFDATFCQSLCHFFAQQYPAMPLRYCVASSARQDDLFIRAAITLYSAAHTNTPIKIEARDGRYPYFSTVFLPAHRLHVTLFTPPHENRMPLVPALASFWTPPDSTKKLSIN